MHDDDLADLEGDAAALLASAEADDDEPPRLAHVCERIIGWPPVRTPDIDVEAKLREVDGALRVLIRSNVPPRRARWLVGHELAEWWHLRAGYVGEDIEARCDAMGAMLAAPRRAFLRAVRAVGHAVYRIADQFAVTQSLVLLRVGEVTGRPVALIRHPAPITRGAPFGWPRTTASALAFSLGEARCYVHPLRITDEPDRWGLMARHGFEMID